jgi:uncharacterized Zn-binding protein involved in type VI secretion
MQKQAARVGDLTSHGDQPLGPGPGSPNVYIGGKRRAWRARRDYHQCPLTTGSVPHMGGIVDTGSRTVLINNRRAARKGDSIKESGPPNKESGPPNTIKKGCKDVLIGD